MDCPDTRIVYSSTVQGLFHIALNGRLTPQARAALLAEGLDLDQDLDPAYPVTVWLRCQDIVLRDLWPDLDRAEALRNLGRTVVEGLSATMMGRAMVTAARALGTRFGLPQVSRILHGSNNFIESRLLQLSAGSCEMWFNDILNRPTYYEGVLMAALHLMGARDPRVQALKSEGRAWTFRLEWTP